MEYIWTMLLYWRKT